MTQAAFASGVSPAPTEIGTLGAFFQPCVAFENRLDRKDEKLIGELIAVLDRQLLGAVGARSESEFKSVRDNVMPRYIRALRALDDTVRILMSDDLRQCFADSVFERLTEDLEKQRDARFGKKLTEQAVFTLWTMQKIRVLGRKIVSAGNPPSDKRQQDSDLLDEYYGASLWAQFHLDVLFCAMKFDRPISGQVCETLCDGLRASVNAYAIMKDAYFLRYPQVTEPVPTTPLPWDAEDEELLAASMRDLNGRADNL